MTRRKRRARSRALNAQKARRAAERREKRAAAERHQSPSTRRSHRYQHSDPHHKKTAALLRQLRFRRPGDIEHSALVPLMKNLTRTLSAERLDRLEVLLRLSDEKLPGLGNVSGVRWLAALTAEPWVEPFEDFRLKGKDRCGTLRSLIRRLLGRYAIPPSLLSELAGLSTHRDPQAARLSDRIALAAHIGRGGSLRAAQRAGLLPAVLTKRMLHQLHSTPAQTLIEAVRKIQVHACGGDAWLAGRLSASFLGTEQQHEPFWHSVIQWLSQPLGLSPLEIRPMLDYLRHRHALSPPDREAPFSITGRSLAAVRRDVEDWHVALRRGAPRPGEAQVYPPSGFVGAKLRVGQETWQVREVLTYRALFEEGRTMRHCVLSYRHRILTSRTSIWSVTCAGRRVLTVEVSNSLKRLVQIRGRCNRLPTPHEEAILRRWAKEAGLALSTAAGL